MLLKSLKLKDFRQFGGDQYVSFSTDPQRNVTIMMGENGAGKTSFAQAFRWCLYGDTDFQNKILLSRVVSEKMLPGDDRDVEVVLDLIHNGTHYIITRRQKYKKNGDGKIATAAGQNKFVIQFKGKDGNTEYVPELETELKMKEILPPDLSRYFFFDGERIEKMSKEIHNGRSRDIGEAVKSLLGLNAFVAALGHLKTVSKRYNDNFNSGAGDEISKIANEITAISDSIDRINTRLSEIDNSEILAQEKCDDLKERIAKNQDSAQLAKDREALKSKLDALETTKKDKIKLLLQDFNKNAPRYFPKKMMKDALQLLQDTDKLDKGIPDIHARTIDFLIKRGSCICGSKVEVGNDIFNALNALREYIPPKSVGNLISEFTTACEDKTKSTETFMDNFEDKFRFIREYEETRSDMEDKLLKIEERLKGMEDTGSLTKDLMSYEKTLREYRDERDTLNQQKGEKDSKKINLEQRRRELSQGNEKNEKIEKYMAYAEYIYNVLKEEYDVREMETREKLAKTINEIFKKIYEGGFSLSLDSKYNVELSADGYAKKQGDDIETSTAQSISIIFAFIAGVIQMAKENQNTENGLASTEPYPLVMDAPLSAFDKKRIETVCEVLPKIAEQVIIFIKNTDGDLAEEKLGSKVGKRYNFAKRNEFETDLTEVG